MRRKKTIDRIGAPLVVSVVLLGTLALFSPASEEAAAPILEAARSVEALVDSLEKFTVMLGEWERLSHQLARWLTQG